MPHTAPAHITDQKPPLDSTSRYGLEKTLELWPRAPPRAPPLAPPAACAATLGGCDARARHSKYSRARLTRRSRPARATRRPPPWRRGRARF
eukprot:scaffold61146_cov57-Phaeocystis_antarctica.AAC.2